MNRRLQEHGGADQGWPREAKVQRFRKAAIRAPSPMERGMDGGQATEQILHLRWGVGRCWWGCLVKIQLMSWFAIHAQLPFPLQRAAFSSHRRQSVSAGSAPGLATMQSSDHLQN